MCASKRLSKQERKREIMESAAKVIIEKGFSNVTMEDIIAGTTMSKGGVYHYYKNSVAIFKDLVSEGMKYRNEIIKEQVVTCPKGAEIECVAKQIVDKILDSNPHTPIYVELLIEKKRYPELNKIFNELKQQTLENLEAFLKDTPYFLTVRESYDMLTDFLNGMVLASNVLDARENFEQHRKKIESMVIWLLKTEDSNPISSKKPEK